MGTGRSGTFAGSGEQRCWRQAYSGCCTCGAIADGARCSAKTAQINTAIHVRERRMWAWIWLVGTYTSLIGMGEILWQISRKGYLDVVDTIICVIFSMAGGLFILAAILWMMKKRQELLKTEEPLSYVDDDIYWKNGWYNNPRDRRWVVPEQNVQFELFF
ncbi:MAG: hypothetical protein ACLT5U_17145 [Mediterraneibacter gnavus]